MDKVEFAKWLQKEIDDREWSQVELTRRSGLSTAQVSRLLSAERGVGEESLIKIARALKLPPDEVFRAAGLLPEAPESTQESEELLHLYHLLPEADRKEILRYVRFIVEGHQKKKK